MTSNGRECYSGLAAPYFGRLYGLGHRFPRKMCRRAVTFCESSRESTRALTVIYTGSYAGVRRAILFVTGTINCADMRALWSIFREPSQLHEVSKENMFSRDHASSPSPFLRLSSVLPIAISNCITTAINLTPATFAAGRNSRASSPKQPARNAHSHASSKAPTSHGLILRQIC
jgi:hypothetical protein